MDEEEDVNASENSQKFVFEPSLKTDIGRYAFHCGNANAVLHFSKKLRFPVKEATVRMFKKAFMDKNDVEVIDATLHRKSQVEEVLPPEEQGVPIPLTVSSHQTASAPKVRLKRRTAAKAQKARVVAKRVKRGQYSCYSPELRAQIAQYASKHGNQETIHYFKSTHDVEVPESTVRGLRDKYLRERKKITDKMSLGPRGRPKRLGKYDSIVQTCIREIAASGERPTAFLAIMTAKQVLTENDPSLLAENGGQVELNTTWAKSFLRRMNLGS